MIDTILVDEGVEQYSEYIEQMTLFPKVSTFALFIFNLQF
jgi:hypothetical protein